jgi:endonuclease-3
MCQLQPKKQKNTVAIPHILCYHCTKEGRNENKIGNNRTCGGTEAALPRRHLFLDYHKDYELLFSASLPPSVPTSGQPGDAHPLFTLSTLEALSGAEISQLEDIIHSCGFFHAKAGISSAPPGCCSPSTAAGPRQHGRAAEAPRCGQENRQSDAGGHFHTPGVVVADTHCIRLSGRLDSPTVPRIPSKWNSS